jgi:hypothetical protein
MSGIIFVALHILPLLLRTHFNRNEDYEKSMEAIRTTKARFGPNSRLNG